MSELLTKRKLLARCINETLTWGFANGYEFTFEEIRRTRAQALANAASGAGIANSLHLYGLAVDINAFKNGVFLTTVAEYLPIGEFWEKLNPDCRWGGRFVRPHPDADHFSITYQGIK